VEQVIGQKKKKEKIKKKVPQSG